MNYYSENDIRQMVADILARSGIACTNAKAAQMQIPIEISARHVHLKVYPKTKEQLPPQT